MNCESVRYSRHAFERMFQRGIPPDAILECIRFGEVIASYPEDAPYPSTLLLGFAGGLPVHVLVARESGTGRCHVVTVYRPDPELWSSDFKTRRQP